MVLQSVPDAFEIAIFYADNFDAFFKYCIKYSETVTLHNKILRVVFPLKILSSAMNKIHIL